MTTTQITGLIEAIYADFTEKMAPALPPEQNYNAAMMKRGLEILAAHIGSENSATQFNLSQAEVYSPAQLAKALRTRDTTVAKSEGLHKLLAEDVQRRRRQANPGSPEERAGKK